MVVASHVSPSRMLDALGCTTYGIQLSENFQALMKYESQNFM